MESLTLSTLNKKKAVLEQLVRGLKALDVLDHIMMKPILFKPLFFSSPAEDLTPGRMISVLFFPDDEGPSKEHLLRFIGDSSKSGMLLYCIITYIINVATNGNTFATQKITGKPLYFKLL